MAEQYRSTAKVDFKSLYDDHASILEQVKYLRTLVSQGIPNNADAISDALHTVTADIRLHLSIEDANIYPALLKNSDPTVRELASKYQMDMGQLLVVYQSFANKYASAELIKNDSEGFRSDANMVFQALFQRIKAENQNLYPTAMKAIGYTS